MCCVSERPVAGWCWAYSVHDCLDLLQAILFIRKIRSLILNGSNPSNEVTQSCRFFLVTGTDLLNRERPNLIMKSRPRKKQKFFGIDKTFPSSQVDFQGTNDAPNLAFSTCYASILLISEKKF